MDSKYDDYLSDLGSFTNTNVEHYRQYLSQLSQFGDEVIPKADFIALCKQYPAIYQDVVGLILAHQLTDSTDYPLGPEFIEGLMVETTAHDSESLVNLHIRTLKESIEQVVWF